MRSLCVLCHKIHGGQNWRYASYETSNGIRYGWFCQKWYKPVTPEFVPERVKEDRKTYAKSLLQPYRGGVPSSEYIQSYGTGRIDPNDVKKAKPVWKDILSTGWEKSK